MLPKLSRPMDHRTADLLRARYAGLMAVDDRLVVRLSPYVGDPVITLEEDGRAWLVAPLARDPLSSPDRGYVVPEDVLRELRRLATAGIEFQEIAVAHELDPDGLVRHLVPQLLDGPRRCPAHLAKVLVGPVPAPRRATAMSHAMTRVTRAATGAARSVPNPLAVLDPIVLGLVGPDARLIPGRPALWVALAAWEW